MRKGRRHERGRATSAVALLVAITVLTFATAGSAQDASSAGPDTAKPWGPRLEYSAAPGCLDEESFRHAVAIFFQGSDPFDANASDVVRVTFQKIPGGYRGSVQKIPAKGDPWPEEETTGPTCSEVFRDVARVASMRVPELPKAAAATPVPGPTAVLKPPAEHPPPEPDPIASHEPPIAPAPSEPRRSHPRKEESAPPMDLTISLSAAALITAGFTADVGPGFQIGAGLRRDWFSIDLEVRGVLPGKAYAREVVDKSLGYSSERSFDASQLSALIVPCIRFEKYFAGCAVGQAGFIITQSRIETGFLPSFGIGPRFAVEVPFAERFGVFGFGEALFYPAARGIAYDLPGPNGEKPPNVAWDPSVVSGFFGAGLSVKFE